MCILVQHLSISNLTCEIALDSDNSDDDDDDDDGGDGAQTKAQKKPSHRYNTRSQPKTTAEQANNEAQVEFEFNGSVYPTYQKMVDAKRSRNERVLERSAKAIAAKLGTEYNKSGSNKKTNQNIDYVLRCSDDFRKKSRVPDAHTPIIRRQTNQQDSLSILRPGFS